MSSLPALTQGSPGSYFFALASGGGKVGSSLQSPVNVIPSAVDGTASLSVVTTAGAVNGAQMLIGDTDGNDVALTLSNTAGGSSDIFMGINGGSSSNFVHINAPSEVLSILNGRSQISFLSVDTINNDVVLGADLIQTTVPSGLTQSNNALVIKDQAGTAANSMLLSPLSPTASVISQGIASGGSLNLGSSVACPGTVVISDAGAGLAQVSIGGNGGPSILLKGGNSTTPTNPSIVGSVGNFGTLEFGSDLVHPRTLTLDVNATGGEVKVSGNGGVGVSLVGGAGTTAFITTTAADTASLQLGASSQYPAILTLTDQGPGGGTNTVLNSNNTTFNSVNTLLNGLVRVPSSLSFQGSGSITAFRTLATNSVVCGDNSTTGIANPAGIPVGLYLILGRGSGAQAGQPSCSVSTISYYNGSVWAWGGGGCCPALVSAPPSYIGIQGAGATLTLANGGGIGAVQMDFIFLQLGGNLGI